MNIDEIEFPKEVWNIIINYLLPKKINLNFKTESAILLKNCFWFYPNILSIYHYGNKNYKKYLYEESLISNKPLSIFYKKNELDQKSLENIYKIFNYNKYNNSKIIYPFLYFCDVLFNIKKYYPYYYNNKLAMLLQYKLTSMPFTNQISRTLFYTNELQHIKHCVEYNLFKIYNIDMFFLIVNNEKNSNIYKEQLEKVINNTFIIDNYENINVINNFHKYYSKSIVNYNIY
tara:strand:- start:751 stop:1443 length:693 start_codon:yes stop_codon:yes gene_type:complete